MMMENVFIIFGILLLAYYLGIFLGAPFVPTDTQTVNKMILEAKIQPGERVVDLGSGDGRLVIAAAKAGAIAHGYEINLLLIWYSRYKIRQAALEGKAIIFNKNFWFQNFSQYDVVLLFGVTGIMSKLEQKLKTELKPGTRVISNTFRFPNWAYEKNGNVFIYRV